MTAAEAPALRECPFCHGDPEDDPKIVPSDMVPNAFIVLCPNCAAAGPITRTEKDASERWNTRALDAAPAGEDVIGVLGKFLMRCTPGARQTEGFRLGVEHCREVARHMMKEASTARAALGGRDKEG